MLQLKFPMYDMKNTKDGAKWSVPDANMYLVISDPKPPLKHPLGTIVSSCADRVEHVLPSCFEYTRRYFLKIYFLERMTLSKVVDI